VRPPVETLARVAEVLKRVRPLKLEMIRKLAAGLELPADVLIRGCGLQKAA
jgi:HTH-type transcriptional regulator/antitoxin HigA